MGTRGGEEEEEFSLVPRCIGHLCCSSSTSFSHSMHSVIGPTPPRKSSLNFSSTGANTGGGSRSTGKGLRPKQTLDGGMPLTINMAIGPSDGWAFLVWWKNDIVGLKT